jgi:hypothetical protein
MSFDTILFDDFIKRIKENKLDLLCFKELAINYYKEKDSQMKIKKYQELSNNDKEKSLQSLAKKCAEQLPKYKNYDWKSVLLDVCYRKSPNNKKMYIFGGFKEEKEIYPTIERFLKNKFKDFTLKNTTAKKSKITRLADFTALKKGLLGLLIISFEVKVKPEAFDYFLNQADDIKKHSDYLYLVATPHFIIEAGFKKTKEINNAEKSILNLLRENGIGLYIIDGYKSKNNIKRILEAQDNLNVKSDIKKKLFDELGLS